MRAFLVMGVPSSGTRLMARIMITAGCQGDGTHRQRWDDTEPTDNLIVIRRHKPIPERRPSWAQDPNLVTSLEVIGYDVHAIIISRDWHCTMASQLAAPHVYSYKEAYQLTRSTWRLMMTQLPGHVPFDIVSYESLVQRPHQVIDNLFERLDLVKATQVEHIRDSNKKYFS